MLQKIILTCATRSLGIRVARQLDEKFAVLQATSDDIPTVIATNYLKIPKAKNPVFAHELLKLALDTESQYILPLDIDEVRVLSQSKVLFDEYGITIVCPSIQQLETMDILPNPPKEMSIGLYYGGRDLLSNESLTHEFSGLGYVSDSGEDFILAISK